MFNMPANSSVANSEFQIAVALGLVPGWRLLRKFGMNDTVQSGVNEMWPRTGSRVQPSVAGVCTVVSDGATDTYPSGIGTRTVRVEGLDADGLEIYEDFELSGLTPVVGSKLFWRINRMYGLTAGSTQLNEGVITASVGGNVQYMIEAGEGQSHQTHYTVPAGHVLLVYEYTIGVGRMANADLDVLSQVRFYDENGTGHWRSFDDLFLYNGARVDHKIMVPITGRADIRQKIVSSTATQADSTFLGYLVDAKYLQGKFASNPSQVNPFS